MPQTTPPRLEGQITITTGVNDQLAWDEGGTPLSITIPPGTYWPADLFAAMVGLMDAESVASGGSRSYTVGHDTDTGLLTIAVDTGTFYPKITAAETQKALTGGDSALHVYGNKGPNHLGFEELIAYELPATSFTSSLVIANSWYPNEPTDKDPGDRPKAMVGQAIGLSSNTFTRKFTDPNNPPTYRNLTFQLIKAAERQQWLETWQLYGAGGGQFALHKPRDNGTRDGLYVLTGASKDDPGFEEQQHHMPWYTGTIHLFRVGD